MRTELSPGLEALAEQATDIALHIELPDPEFIDLGPQRLASLVAQTSNAYGRAARLAGMARAEAKLARGRFERKYKSSRRGANDYERDANAMEAAAWEHEVWVEADAIATLADGVESAARIASESARKLLGQQSDMMMAEMRGARGQLEDKDYQPY